MKTTTSKKFRARVALNEIKSSDLMFSQGVAHAHLGCDNALPVVPAFNAGHSDQCCGSGSGSERIQTFLQDPDPNNWFGSASRSDQSRFGSTTLILIPTCVVAAELTKGAAHKQTSRY